MKWTRLLGHTVSLYEVHYRNQNGGVLAAMHLYQDYTNAAVSKTQEQTVHKAATKRQFNKKNKKKKQYTSRHTNPKKPKKKKTQIKKKK